jgi:cation diffusion facilitator family transporter
VTHASTSRTSRRSLERTRQAGGSRKTVLIALTANAVVAVAKLGAGLLSGSTAMLAEAAHSLADTINQAFLLASIRLAKRDPTEEQPWGHGRQRFIWTFLAAVGMFVAGATFAVGYGIAQLLRGGESEGSPLIVWLTLLVAATADGVSWLRAVRQTRAEARDAGKPWRRHIRETRDPNVKMVFYEDTAALIGVLIAAAGIGLAELTGRAFWDPLASIFVGLLLIAVAIGMARDTAHLLAGASATPEERERIEQVIGEHDGVSEIVELLTMVLAPNALLVAARIDVDDRLHGDELERLASRLDDALRDAVPDVTEVFLDATPGRASDTGSDSPSGTVDPAGSRV